MSPRSMVDFYAVQFRLLRHWSGGPLVLAGRAVLALLAGVAAILVTIWLIPGIRIADLSAALVTAVVLATLTTLARPVLIGLLSAFSVMFVGLGTIALQLIIFFILSRTSTAVVIDGARSAVIGALTYSFVGTLLTACLSLADDHAFFGTLVRQLAARHHAVDRADEVGTVFIQIDGLSHPMLERTLATGRLRTISRWLAAGHTLTEWQPLLPTQTSASQAGILHGNNDGIPGFRWWDKERKHLMVSNHPEDTREMQRRVSNGRGLLADGGASISNLLSGDAPRSFITAATIKSPGTELAHSHVQDWFFVSPYSVLRWIFLSFGEVGKELVQAARSPHDGRGLSFGLARAATNVLLRHLNAALVVEEMYRGTPRIYVDFVDYDENAHHAGPEGVEGADAIRGLDRIIGLIEEAAADAPRRYRFVVLSDHGQSPGASFKERYGKSLETLVDDLTGDATVRASVGHAEHWGHLNALASGGPLGSLTTRLLGRPARGRTPGGSEADVPDIVVAASGNLAHIAFARRPGRVTRSEIDALHPGLLDALVQHPGIGLVMVRNAEGSVVLGASGSHRLADGQIAGTDPIAQFGPHAADGLRRIDGMKDCGDIVVIGSYDSSTGEVAPLENQVGSHGGLGGVQNRAFILHPREWKTDGAIVGATALHEQLVAWLSESDGAARGHVGQAP